MSSVTPGPAWRSRSEVRDHSEARFDAQSCCEGPFEQSRSSECWKSRSPSRFTSSQNSLRHRAFEKIAIENLERNVARNLEPEIAPRSRNSPMKKMLASYPKTSGVIPSDLFIVSGQGRCLRGRDMLPSNRDSPMNGASRSTSLRIVRCCAGVRSPCGNAAVAPCRRMAFSPLYR
jgi:hypothetical protein